MFSRLQLLRAKRYTNRFALDTFSWLFCLQHKVFDYEHRRHQREMGRHVGWVESEVSSEVLVLSQHPRNSLKTPQGSLKVPSSTILKESSNVDFDHDVLSRHRCSSGRIQKPSTRISIVWFLDSHWLSQSGVWRSVGSCLEFKLLRTRKVQS